MTRDEIYAETIRKTRKQVGQMMRNRRFEDDVRRVRVKNRFMLEIDCARNDTPGDSFAEPLEFQIYAVIKGEDTDCATVAAYGIDETLDKVESEVRFAGLLAQGGLDDGQRAGAARHSKMAAWTNLQGGEAEAAA